MLFCLAIAYIIIGAFSELVFHRAEQDEFGEDLPRNFRASVTRFVAWPFAWYFFIKNGYLS